MRVPRALALAACACLALGACDSREHGEVAAPPAQVDENLETLVPSLVDAVQAKQVAFVMDHVAPAFKEERGLDYYDVRALLEKYALGEEPIGARLESVELTPLGDARQRVSARVAFARGQRLAVGAPLPEGGVVYALEVDFARNGARWQAVTGRYARVSPAPATSPETPETATR
ncbi:MAG TPA: hypothetical protein VMR50_11495 [Myxococcota bacterium]|nr:hypothetical protein [Myxococcota bacterium]